MRHKIIIIILCFISNLIYSQNWNLIWNDEFDGLDLDNSKWTHDIGTASQFGLWVKMGITVLSITEYCC